MINLYNLVTQKVKRFGFKATLAEVLVKLLPNIHTIPFVKKVTKIPFLVYQFQELNFVEKCLPKLNKIAISPKNSFFKTEALWELVKWHSNKHNSDDAAIPTDYLNRLIPLLRNKNQIVKATAIEVEMLALLNKHDLAKKRVEEALDKHPNEELFIARANLSTTPEEKNLWFNKVLKLHNLSEITLPKTSYGNCLEMVTTSKSGVKSEKMPDNCPKVSVIIPAYNAGDFIGAALKSLLSQTYQNIEIIVVDDCSTDNTYEVAKQYSNNNKQVKVLQTSQNMGAYTARNLGLHNAMGDFVTCHDTDDWSHPQKIEIQAKHLVENKAVVGNLSQLIRVRGNFIFTKNLFLNCYIHQNPSSFMFRRKEVLELAGYWDPVRFGGDDEYIARIRALAGYNSVKILNSGPLALAHQQTTSLTNHSAFGYYEKLFGARKEYAEAYRFFHKAKKGLHISYPSQKRAFAVPKPLLPGYSKDGGEVEQFDIILFSEFRLDKKGCEQQIQIIKGYLKQNKKIGLAQKNIFNHYTLSICTTIREIMENKGVRMVVYGEKVSAKTVLISLIEAFEEYQEYIPKVDTEKVVVLYENTTTKKEIAEGRVAKCKKNIYRYFGEGVLIEEHVFDNKIFNMQL